MYRKYPRKNAHFFNQNFNIKTGGALYIWVYLYICGYVEKYHICGLKVGVHIICGYALYMGIYGNSPIPLACFLVTLQISSSRRAA